MKTGLHGFQKISSGGDKVKREKLNLGEKVAVICEGGAETAIMEIYITGSDERLNYF